MTANCVDEHDESNSTTAASSSPKERNVDQQSEDSLQDQDSTVLSVGSQGHGKGACKPCHFIRTPIGCKSGSDCEFCHLAHKGRGTPRQSKSKRKRYRNFCIKMAADCELDEASGEEKADRPESQSPIAIDQALLLESIQQQLQLLTLKAKASEWHPPPPGLESPETTLQSLSWPWAAEAFGGNFEA